MNAPSIITATEATVTVDPRLVVLARAGVKHDLVVAGVVHLDDAFVDIATAVIDIAPTHLIEREGRRVHERRHRPTPQPTPQCTIEAVMHTVRQRGVAALKEPANRERLSRCDAAARAQIDSRIAKLVAPKAGTT